MTTYCSPDLLSTLCTSHGTAVDSSTVYFRLADEYNVTEQTKAIKE